MHRKTAPHSGIIRWLGAGEFVAYDRYLPAALWIASVVLLFTSGIAPVHGECACTAFGPGVSWGTVSFNALAEGSGLAASLRNPGVLWTHNDGSGQEIFALSTSGAQLATLGFNSAVDDTEDMAIGPGPVNGVSYLYLGDIGGNTFAGEVRTSIKIIRVPEPVVDLAWAGSPRSSVMEGVETFTLVYPDGGHDAESLMVDAISGDVFIATKQDVGSRIYRANLMASPNQSTVTMQYVRTVSFDLASGGSISADGTQIVLRREDFAMIWERCAGVTVGEALAAAGWSIPVTGPPTEPNGEAIALLPDGSGYVTISEKKNPVLYFFQALCPSPAHFIFRQTDQSGFVGGSATFSAMAAGYPSPTYQWEFDGQPLPGQTNASLVLSNISANQAGVYKVTASNGSGSVNAAATLTIRTKPVLRITEVMPRQASGAAVPIEDWWELTSFESQPVDLSGWRFNDNGGDLDDPFVFPSGLLINPGESIVFTQDLTAAQFRQWWGSANVPASIQIITYTGSGLALGNSGDGIRLWAPQTADPNDTIARVDFGTASAGVSFNYNPGTGQFGALSQLGVNGVFNAASTADIGSPGRIRVPAVSPPLHISQVAGGKIRIAFDAIAGFRYSLQTRPALETPTWEPTADILQPSANGRIFFDKEIIGSRHFYRVVVE